MQQVRTVPGVKSQNGADNRNSSLTAFATFTDTSPKPPQLLRKSGKPAKDSGGSSAPDFWVETISDLPGPRIYVLHNMITRRGRVPVHPRVHYRAGA